MHVRKIGYTRPKVHTRPFKIVLTKEQLAQCVGSRSALLVRIKRLFNVFVANQKGLCAFLFGLVPRLARVNGLQPQQELRGPLGWILIIKFSTTVGME